LFVCLIKYILVDPFISADDMVYMLKHDSTRGRFNGEVLQKDEKLVVNEQEINVFNEYIFKINKY